MLSQITRMHSRDRSLSGSEDGAAQRTRMRAEFWKVNCSRGKSVFVPKQPAMELAGVPADRDERCLLHGHSEECWTPLHGAFGLGGIE